MKIGAEVFKPQRKCPAAESKPPVRWISTLIHTATSGDGKDRARTRRGATTGIFRASSTLRDRRRFCHEDRDREVRPLRCCEIDSYDRRNAARETVTGRRFLSP